MSQRIIVIDNDPKILEVVQEALQDEGFEVEVYSQTSDVIDLVQQQQPDLLILDYILDGINGGEFCRQLKKQSATAGLPVILCSGYSKVLYSLGFYGCDTFLEKPFDHRELIQQVQLLLNGKPKAVSSV